VVVAVIVGVVVVVVVVVVGGGGGGGVVTIVEPVPSIMDVAELEASVHVLASQALSIPEQSPLPQSHSSPLSTSKYPSPHTAVYKVSEFIHD